MPFDAQKKYEEESDLHLAPEKLFCASCGHWITWGEWRISIKDGHEHTVFNPAGIIFTIGCFSDAPGCWSTGQPSSQFTWFPGHEWRLSLCEGCGKHLGWMFNTLNGDSAFYGLILNRLTKEPRD